MPIIEAEEVAFSSPVKGEDYIIPLVQLREDVDVGEGESASGLSVSYEPEKRHDADNNIYRETLWLSANYTKKSKLGSHIYALQEYAEKNPIHPILNVPINPKNSDHWEGMIVRILSWEAKNRDVQVRGFIVSERLDTLKTTILERLSQVVKA
jgi:hypothetical protein